MEIKYKQHYVPQGYLKKWYDDKNRLWIIRNNSIFTSRTENICQEKLFYKIKHLSNEELCVMIYLLKKVPEPIKSNLFYIIITLNNISIKEKQLSDSLKLKLTNNKREEIEEEIDKIKILTNNTLEDIYGSFDDILCKRINSIIENYNYNSIIKDTQDHMLLLIIIIQLYRTNKARYHSVNTTNKLLKGYPLIKEVDWENVITYIPIILGAETANKMIYNNYKLHVVINNTKIPFITSDSPVINIDRKSKIATFIFPISPYKAIVISRIGIKINFSRRKTIESINKKIIKESHEILIFNNQNIAKKYKKYIFITSNIKKIKYYFHYNKK